MVRVYCEGHQFDRGMLLSRLFRVDDGRSEQSVRGRKRRNATELQSQLYQHGGFYFQGYQLQITVHPRDHCADMAPPEQTPARSQPVEDDDEPDDW